MKLTTAAIDLKAIHPVFSWSLHQDMLPDPAPEMVKSIKRFGLLRPIILRKNQESHELICGAMRVAALQQLGEVRDIPCCIVDPCLVNTELLQLAAEDQKQSAPLSPIETARLIDMFQSIAQGVDKTVLETATGTRSDSERKRLLALLELEEPIRRAIHQGFIPVKNGLSLAAMSSSERIFLFQLFFRLSLNGNKQRRLLELARIISVSEQRSMVDVFTEHYPQFCGGSIDNIPQASAQLMKSLYELSHPRLTGAQKQFNEKRSSLNLPDNCSLSPWPAFERETVTLAVEFKDFESFRGAWEIIKQSL